MNRIKISVLFLFSSLLALSSTHAASDLIVHSGGTLIVRNNVQVNNGRFTVESGGVVNIDLGSKVSATNIVYGGTLTVSSNNIVLATGQNYQLFDAPSYSGAFLVVHLPALASSMTWSNTLSDNGTVSVAPVAPPVMQFSTLSYSASEITMGGSGGTSNGSYLVLASTNVAQPTANWTIVATNVCDSSGNFIFTQPISTTVPQQFFLLQVP